MVAYKSNELVPSSEFAKKFGSYLTQIKEHSVDKLAILKNNKVEAVLISKDEYEMMSELLKLVESKELLASIKSGLKDIENSKTYPIDELWDKLDD
ncbi:MAG: type II toxin-antitoxin system Phd/YefM family antitoxin [Thiovulaceae bacterium]|nr:type II toxin-antitoxin system Phd/YefM family antitoxin [Sulfurimonadaceae bacterium]